jgi:type VI secretion system protein ImpL
MPDIMKLQRPGRSLIHALAASVGTAAALALIWFTGPLVEIGGVAPLAGERARWMTVAAGLAFATTCAFWRAARAAATNRRLMDALAGAPAPRRVAGHAAADRSAPSPGAAEVEVIGESFERALALLKRGRIGASRSWLGALRGCRYVYELPWYVIVGAPGSGKTTALVNSGLEFPLEAQIGRKVIRGIGGTRHCDWWFTNDAVLIDTAGRYTTQDSHRAADSGAWLGFLDLLARHRPGRPLNGVLLTLSVSDLMNPEPAKRAAHARELRERVQELHARLGLRLPIYAVVTKTDLLAGFVEFFADFDKEERAQVWGVTFPHDTEPTSADPLARLPSDLAALEQRLNECLVERLHAEHDRDRRAALYAFPQQWSALHESLLELLPAVFGVSPEGARPLLRGLYFTSATQEGTPIDRAIGGLARSMGLVGRIVLPSRSTSKAFFVTRMLREVVLKEAGLAGTNLRWQRRRESLGWAVSGATVCLVVAAAALSWSAYANGRAQLAATSQRLAALARDVAAAQGTKIGDLAALLPPLQTLQALVPASDSVAGAWPTWLDVRGNQAAMFGAAARDAYQRLLEGAFLPRIAARLEERLRAGDRQHVERVYEDLKAYQMLFGGKNFDRTALRSFISADWDATLPASVSVADRDALRRHLDRLLAGGEVGAPSQLQPQIVANARELVGSTSLAQRAYSRLQQLDLGSEVAPFTVDTAAGATARRLFARASGQPLSHGVPGLYSRAVLRQSFRQRTQEVLRQLASEQSWVLGTSGAYALEPAAQARLIDDIERRYLADYTRLWAAFVADLRLAPSSTLAASAEMAQALARADSPLPAVLRGVVREVSVAALPAAGDAAAPAPANTPVDDSLIDPQFDALRQFVTGQPSPLDDTLTLLGRLGAHLSAADDAAKRRAAPPSSDVIRELVLAAQRSPEPVRSMLAQLAQASAGQAFAALREPLGRQLSDELAPACARATAGRYPFVRSASEEVSREDFTRTFAAGGVLDGFYQRSLAPYVDTSARPWAFRRSDGTRGEGAESLLQFQRAQSIRQAFFRDGARAFGTALEFRLLELDPGTRLFTLEVDGQSMRFGRDQKAPLGVQWPGPPGSASRVRLQMTPITGTPTDFTFDGPWALLRLFDRVRIEPGSAPDRAQLVFDVEGRKARFEVRGSAALMPLTPLMRQELEQFQCPKHL